MIVQINILDVRKMSQVIEILTSLGIDETVFMQFAVFFLAYISMNFIVFKPYMAAYNERMSRTVGGQELAEKMLSEAAEKEETFKNTARDLNQKIRESFQQWDSKAKQETESILADAKQQSEVELKKAQKDLELAVEQVRGDLKTHVTQLSKNIQDKIVRQ